MVRVRRRPPAIKPLSQCIYIHCARLRCAGASRTSGCAVRLVSSAGRHRRMSPHGNRPARATDPRGPAWPRRPIRPPDASRYRDAAPPGCCARRDRPPCRTAPSHRERRHELPVARRGRRGCPRAPRRAAASDRATPCERRAQADALHRLNGLPFELARILAPVTSTIVGITSMRCAGWRSRALRRLAGMPRGQCTMSGAAMPPSWVKCLNRRNGVLPSAAQFMPRYRFEFGPPGGSR